MGGAVGFWDGCWARFCMGLRAFGQIVKMGVVGTVLGATL